MWSPTLLFDHRAYGPEKLCSVMQKTFATLRTDIPIVPGHPQDRDIFRGQPRKKNFASMSLFPLGDV